MFFYPCRSPFLCTPLARHPAPFFLAYLFGGSFQCISGSYSFISLHYRCLTESLGFYCFWFSPTISPALSCCAQVCRDEKSGLKPRANDLPFPHIVPAALRRNVLLIGRRGLREVTAIRLHIFLKFRSCIINQSFFSLYNPIKLAHKCLRWIMYL